MLNALEAQLKQLALDSKDPFATTIRRLVGLPEAPRYAKPLRRFVLAMPTMIREIQAWSGQTEQPPSLRRLQLYALNYLYSPTDFLPDGNLGLFSYLDDVYLLASVMQRTLNESEAIGKRLSIRDKSVRKELPNWLNMTRQLLPTETMKIDQLMDEINHRGDEGMAWAMSHSAKGGPSSRRLKGRK